MKNLILAVFIPLGLIACGGEEESNGHDHGPGGHAHGDDASTTKASDHGEQVDLGTVTVAGHVFSVTRLGEVEPGKEAAFEVAFAGASKGSPMTNANVFLWLEAEAGDRVSAPAKGDVEGDKWHVHTIPSKAPIRVVLRVRAGGADDRAGLPLSGHGHEHGESPHDGIVAMFRGPNGTAEAGHLELKLHDDKGDLELWLAKDAKLSDPLDLPLDARIKVTFIDHDNREVTLAVRNKNKNEDEDGKPNIRNGQTNYFIFPGDSGKDAKWLQGKQFQSIVKVTFERDGKTYVSEEFVLVPHSH